MPSSLSTDALPESSLLGTPAGDLMLRIRGTERHGQTVRLSGRKCSIGSGPQCTLRLRSPGVQPVHCLVLRGATGNVVRRWSADTRLNGALFGDAPLRPGDLLGIGPLELEVVELPRTPVAPPVAEDRDVTSHFSDDERETLREFAASDSPATGRREKQEGGRLFGSAALERLQDALESNRVSNRRCVGRLRETRRNLDHLDQLSAERQKSVQAFAERLARLENRPVAAGESVVLPPQQLSVLADAVSSLNSELSEQRRLRTEHDSQLRMEIEAVRAALGLIENRRTEGAPTTPARIAEAVEPTEAISLEERQHLERQAAELSARAESLEMRSTQLDQQSQALDARAQQIEQLAFELAEQSRQLAAPQGEAFVAAESLPVRKSPVESMPEWSPENASAPTVETPVVEPIAEPITEPIAESVVEQIDKLASPIAEAEATPPRVATLDSCGFEELAEAAPATVENNASQPSGETEEEEHLPPTVAEVLARFGRKPEEAAPELTSTFGSPEWNSPGVANAADALPPSAEEGTAAAATLPGVSPEFSALLREIAPAAPETPADCSPGEAAEFTSTVGESQFVETPDADESSETNGETAPEPNATTADEAPPESLDWEHRRAMLLEQEESRQAQESADLRQREQELMQQRHQEPAPAEASETSSDGEEESIEAYMTRLLQRVGGAPDGQPATSAASTPNDKGKEKAKVADTASASHGDESTKALEPEKPAVTPFANASEFVPRAQAPEKTASLEAMRELANSSARSAIESHDKRRGGGDVAAWKLVVSVLGLVGAIVAWQFAGFGSWFGIGGVIAGLAVAGVWGYLALKNHELASAKNTAVTAVEFKPQLDDEDEAAGFNETAFQLESFDEADDSPQDSGA